MNSGQSAGINPHVCQVMIINIFIIDIFFVDVAELSAYASSGALPGRQGHTRALALALRGQQDYSRAKDVILKNLKLLQRRQAAKVLE